MLVFHGSYMEVKIPDIGCGRVKLDFGKGFYVTTLRDQAEKWARRRAKTEQTKPVVSVYEFAADNLDILTLDGYTEEWLAYVVKNRSEAHVPHSYDAIYGNIADDDVATIVNDYIRLLRKGRINADDKRFYLRQLQYSDPSSQHCIATKKGIEALHFIESYTLEG